MIDIKLKPCPFCGGEVQHGAYVAYSLDSSFDAIECENCEFYFNTEKMSENEAAIEFNKRPIEGALTKENAQLKADKAELAEYLHDIAETILDAGHIVIDSGNGWDKEIRKLIQKHKTQ